MVDVNQALDEAQIVAGKSHMYDLAELARAAHPDATVVVLSESDQGNWLGVDSIVRQEDDLARIEEEDDYFEDDGHASNLYTDVYVLRELFIQYDVRGEIEYSDRMGLRSFHMDVAKVLAELGTEPPRNLALFTTEDAETLMGRPITDQEYRHLVKALEHSSMGEAFTEVVHAVCGYPDDDTED